MQLGGDFQQARRSRTGGYYHQQCRCSGGGSGEQGIRSGYRIPLQTTRSVNTRSLKEKKHRQSFGFWAGLRGVNTGNRNCKLGEDNESVLKKHVHLVLNQT